MKTYFCSGCSRIVLRDYTRPDETIYCLSVAKYVPLLKPKRTKWFNVVKNPPVREGWYEIKNIGCERAYWSSGLFRRNGKMPFVWPSEIMWRGLTPK